MITNGNHTWKQLTLDFNKELSNALLQQHHAAQFIALAGRYLIPQEADDSNTNMQYQADREWLVGNVLSGGMRIALHLPDLELFTIDKFNHCRSEIPLAGKSKQQVFEQLKQNLSDLGLDVSKFRKELHYTLPDHELDKNAAFLTGDKKYTQENIFYRHNAEIIISKIASNFKKADPVRIWPHHFDTGSSIPVGYNANGGVSKSIGLGWAIPDDMIDEPYYYLSFWSESPVGDFSELPAPEAGEWIRTGWNGGVARHSDILKISSAGRQQEFVELFFNSGIKILSEHFNL